MAMKLELARKSTIDRQTLERLKFETAAAASPKITNWRDAESIVILPAPKPLPAVQLPSKPELLHWSTP